MTFGSNMPGMAVPTGPGSPSHDRDGVEFPQLELPFLDDTGASTMVISEDDMLLLMGGDAAYSNAPMDHLMGYDSLRTADGSFVVTKTIAVQVNMYGTNEYNYQGLMVSDWTTIPCSVIDNTGGNDVERLNGPWFRSMLYVGSAPQFPPTVYAGPNKRSIMARDMIPVVEASRTGPHFSIPVHGTQWVPVPASFMSIAHEDPKIPGRVP